MPCKEVFTGDETQDGGDDGTDDGTTNGGHPDIQDPQFTLASPSPEIISVEYSVENTGDAEGTADVDIEIDVGDDGEFDDSRSESIDVGPGETVEVQTTISLDLTSDRTVRVCVGLDGSNLMCKKTVVEAPTTGVNGGDGGQDGGNGDGGQDIEDEGISGTTIALGAGALVVGFLAARRDNNGN